MIAALALIPLCWLSACAGSSVTAGSASGSGGFFGGTGTDASSGADGLPSSGTGGTTPDLLPPEREVDPAFQVPVATGRYVWIANPLSGRVAFVDASTLQVRTVEAGNAPTFLAPVPGSADAVVVMNVLSHDATFMRADPATGRLTSTMIPGIAPLANAWAIAPDGRFALAWTDARRALAQGPGTGSLEGFQDVTAIDLSAQPPSATTVAVGYRPVSVTFSADGRRAFAVTEDGVSVIALPAAAAGGAVQVIRDVRLTSDPTESADTRDVSVTADGRAIVRREGSPDVRIVDLTTGATAIVTLTGPVTDLDVTADGTRAVAVVRQTSQVAILPLATAGADPATVLYTIIAGEVVGSVVVTADGKQAILYSNATSSDRLVVLDLVTAAYRVLRVHAPVLSLFPTPDGQFAVVLHQQPAAIPGAGATSPDGGAADAGILDGGASVDAGGPAGTPPTAVTPPAIATAFSVLPLDGSRSGRIQETGAPPRAVAFAPDSSRALVTVRDDVTRVYGVFVVGLPGLQVSRLDLASPPISTGVVASVARGYVAQVHPEGRITFIPFSGGVPRTLTGFDLGARIVDGVSP